MSDSYLMLISGALIALSVVASKLSDRIGVPALLVFLAIGMSAGSDVLGLVYFDDSRLANAVGTVALAYILFSGGIDTRWIAVRPVVGRGVLLATVGVVLTAVILAAIASFALGFSFQGSLLLASIVSSTDAAAVFSVLDRKSTRLNSRHESP